MLMLITGREAELSTSLLDDNHYCNPLLYHFFFLVIKNLPDKKTLQSLKNIKKKLFSEFNKR